MKYDFVNALKKDTLHHSFIIEGSLSVDKYKYVIDICKTIFCEEDENFCDNCSNCKKINQNIHPDIILVEAENRKGQKNKSIKVEQITELQDKLSKKPFESERLIGIIKDADTLSANGFNKILKTIEEPLGNAIIILMSENMRKMPNTVLSRCIKVVVPNRYSLKEDDYGYRQAFELVRLILNDEFFYRIKSEIEEFVKDKKNARILLDNMEVIILDIVLKKIDIGRNISINKLFNCIDEIQKTRREIEDKGNEMYSLKKLALILGG